MRTGLRLNGHDLQPCLHWESGNPNLWLNLKPKFEIREVENQFWEDPFLQHHNTIIQTLLKNKLPKIRLFMLLVMFMFSSPRIWANNSAKHDCQPSSLKDMLPSKHVPEMDSKISESVPSSNNSFATKTAIEIGRPNKHVNPRAGENRRSNGVEHPFESLATKTFETKSHVSLHSN